MRSFNPEGQPQQPPASGGAQPRATQPPAGHFQPQHNQQVAQGQVPAQQQQAPVQQQYATPAQQRAPQQQQQMPPQQQGQAPQRQVAPHQGQQPQAPQQQYAAPQTQRPPVHQQAPGQAAPQQGAPQQAQTVAPAQQTQPPARPQAGASGQRIGVGQERQESDLDLAAVLRAMLKAGASDLHLTSGAPPMMRLDGGLKPIEGWGPQVPESLQRVLYGILTQKQRETFDEHLELDLSYSLVGEARFRVNIYQQRNSIGAAFRVIPYEIKALEALGVPEAIGKFAYLPRGLVLVTGPTGSGKSTTLASLIDLANRSRTDHIMTVEDPIEFLHRHKRALVNQREVGTDTKSFGEALKRVLRQDPDIILIGELRDLETIQVALTAAETGHLVFATLHTQGAAETIDRVIDVFPAEQQGQVRAQLGSAIQGVVSQTLLKKAEGKGRAVAVELMVATPGIRNLIREGKTHQIKTSMQAGASLGMQAMDQNLADLVKSGTVAYEEAVEACQDVEEFNRLCGRYGRE